MVTDVQRKLMCGARGCAGAGGDGAHVLGDDGCGAPGGHLGDAVL
jgi:hypothetical protein